MRKMFFSFSLFSNTQLLFNIKEEYGKIYF